MRVLWVGDAVVSTGFAACTHAVCNALHSAGHEVYVLGINYTSDGEDHGYPYRIYPCREPFHNDGKFGVSRLPRLMQQLAPDIVVILQDPWNIAYYLMSIADWWAPNSPPPIPIVPWLAVDAKNQMSAPVLNSSSIAHVAVWTQFAADELTSSGYIGTPSIVPLGVDTSIFYPRDKSESRSLACPADLPSDAYIVGVVGRNQPRKRLDLTIQYFAHWVNSHNIDNAWLYLHVGPTGDRGCDIKSLVRYYGISGRVILAQPEIGAGLPIEHMPTVYSCFDLYFSTTQGEGWGLPALEAMACGVPCALPDSAGYGSWARDAAVLIPCSSTAPSAPLDKLAHTVGSIMDADECVRTLNELYLSNTLRNELSMEGLKLAGELTWQRTGQMFTEILESVLENHHRKLTNAAQEAATADAEVQLA